MLAPRVREGIREAGGICFEFPVHPIQARASGPTSLDRNLAYLGLVEILYGFIGGVVLAARQSTPSQLMAAATVDLPAIVLSGGPMLNGWFRGERTGSGTIVWKARQMFATGEISYEEFVELVASSAPSPGHCNTMGTASTMNSLAEALGMSLPGCAAIPAPHKERAQIAYLTGKRIVDMVWEDLRPSKIMTREAFENVIVVNSAIGGRAQRADPFQRDRQAYRRAARQRRLGEGGLRHSAAGRHATGRPLPRRGVSSRRRRVGRGQRADEGRQDPRARADRPTAAAWARTAPTAPSATMTSSAPTRSR